MDIPPAEDDIDILLRMKQNIERGESQINALQRDVLDVYRAKIDNVEMPDDEDVSEEAIAKRIQVADDEGWFEYYIDVMHQASQLKSREAERFIRNRMKKLSDQAITQKRPGTDIEKFVRLKTQKAIVPQSVIDKLEFLAKSRPETREAVERTLAKYRALPLPSEVIETETIGESILTTKTAL